MWIGNDYKAPVYFRRAVGDSTDACEWKPVIPTETKGDGQGHNRLIHKFTASGMNVTSIAQYSITHYLRQDVNPMATQRFPGRLTWTTYGINTSLTSNDFNTTTSPTLVNNFTCMLAPTSLTYMQYHSIKASSAFTNPVHTIPTVPSGETTCLLSDHFWDITPGAWEIDWYTWNTAVNTEYGYNPDRKLVLSIDELATGNNRVDCYDMCISCIDTDNRWHCNWSIVGHGSTSHIPYTGIYDFVFDSFTSTSSAVPDKIYITPLIWVDDTDERYSYQYIPHWVALRFTLSIVEPAS